ncbi:4956_t:CDS:2, partial [Ambispora gerdemannii]
ILQFSPQKVTDMDKKFLTHEITSINKTRKDYSKTSNAPHFKSSFENVLASLQENEDLENSTNIKVRRQQKWSRPKLPDINPVQDHIIFQQIEVDEYNDLSMRRPIVRLYGVTERGNSVLCHVSGFLPYFYIPAPVGFKDNDVSHFQRSLEQILSAGNKVFRIEIMMKESIWGYHGNQKNPFLKLTFNDSRALSQAKNILCLYLIITGANWIELPAKSYIILAETRKTSNCQLEVEIRHENLISHAPDSEWSKIAPLRILSFDIECAGRKGSFPEASIDPVIQIANTVTIQGENKPFIRNVFTLDTCAPIVATDIIENVNEVDPDVIIGYNIANFDLPYLLDRAHHLKELSFPFLGRIS